MEKSVQLQAAAALLVDMTFQTETAYTFSGLHDGSCSNDGRFYGMNSYVPTFRRNAVPSNRTQSKISPLHFL